MGVSIEMKQRGKWISITPGWRSQMASWLRDVSGSTKDTLVLTDADIASLEHHKEHQRKGIDDPPFDQSDGWVECFDKILAEIREHGEALIRMQW